jgi:hypothetical protein
MVRHAGSIERASGGRDVAGGVNENGGLGSKYQWHEMCTISAWEIGWVIMSRRQIFSRRFALP